MVLNPAFADFLLPAAAMAAFIGHSFPVFSGFRGGKGVACMLGAGMVLFPLPMLFAVGLFVLVLLLTRYVSLASILAALTFSFQSHYIFGVDDVGLLILTSIAGFSIILLHIPNIKRFVKGEEKRIQWKKK